MAFYFADSQGRPIGPYSREELAFFVDRGLIEAGTAVTENATGIPRTVGEVLEEARPATETQPSSRVLSGLPVAPRGWIAGDAGGRPGLSESGGAGRPLSGEGSTGSGALGASPGSDLLRLAPHLMLPIEDLVRLRWLDNRRILALAVAGLLPLLLLFYLQATYDLAGAIWGVALYTSGLWALFFYVAFSQPQVRWFTCLVTYLGSALFSVSLVALARFIIPLEWVAVWITSPQILTRWGGHLVGVAAIEELAKLFMLYFLWPKRLPPQVMMFYGLMAGLGFGIYEGVAYQSSQNLRISFPEGRPTPDGAAIYYILNILRLTSLPFLHALWTGIAGYFVGFAAQYPVRRGGLLFAALAIPSLLHATYNTFSASMIGVTVAVVTILALNLYLAKGADFERVLRD